MLGLLGAAISGYGGEKLDDIKTQEAMARTIDLRELEFELDKQLKEMGHEARLDEAESKHGLRMKELEYGADRSDARAQASDARALLRARASARNKELKRKQEDDKVGLGLTEEGEGVDFAARLEEILGPSAKMSGEPKPATVAPAGSTAPVVPSGDAGGRKARRVQETRNVFAEPLEDNRPRTKYRGPRRTE